MDKFKSTLRLPSDKITGSNSLPISDGFTYFDIEKNILYKDANGQRYALAEVFKVNELNCDSFGEKSKLKNVIVINKKSDIHVGPLSMIFRNKLWENDYNLIILPLLATIYPPNKK